MLHETFVAARALVATGGRLVVQSTPADESGDFHELVMAEDPAWARFTVPSDAVPTISAAFLEAERRALGPDAYATEYECTFGKAGATLFTADRLASLILPGGLMKHIGIVIADRGAAIVTVEHGPDEALLVTGIERLPFDLGWVAERVRALTEPDTRYVIDAEGLGSALWAVLGHGEDRHWTLYAGRGLERQALVDELLVAIEQDRFRFAAGLAEQDAMSQGPARLPPTGPGRRPHRLRARRGAAAGAHPAGLRARAAVRLGLTDDDGPVRPVQGPDGRPTSIARATLGRLPSPEYPRSS